MASQSFLFDTVAPAVTSLGLADNAATFLRSDQRDMCIVGRANEGLAGARVTSALGNNVGTLDPPAPIQVGANSHFMAAPVTAGIIDPSLGPIQFELQSFDHALNTRTPGFAGQFQQVGIASTGAVLAPGDPLEVWVFNAETLEPIQGAKVFVHEDDGSAYPLASNGVTNGQGMLQLASAAGGESILTVDVATYNLFTFHGVPRSRVQVLLQPTIPAAANWLGQVQTAFPDAPISNTDVFVSDTRLAPSGSLYRATGPVSLDTGAGVYRATFGPELARPNRMGFGTFIAGDLDLVQPAFTALGFLRAFGWETGQEALATDGLPTPSLLYAGGLLSTGGVEDLPIEVSAQSLSGVAATSLGTISNAPRVMVDGISPGMDRPILVGLGIAYSSGANTWDIRSAIPGVVDGVQDNANDELGVLVEFGTLEADHYLRVEVEDDLANLSVVRRQLSQLDGSLVLLDVPVLQSPAQASTVGAASYTVEISDPLRDGLGMGGMYRIDIADGGGRVWTLWRQDPADGAPGVQVRLPNIGLSGGTPLPNGAKVCVASCFGFAGLDDSEFLWSDLYRRAELYVRSRPFAFVQ
ncbi:MAG: hypothetical protein R3E96_10195 [Planctomycetota bacterium]